MVSVMQGAPADVVAQFIQFMSQSAGSLTGLFARLNLFILVPVFIATGLLLIGYFRHYQRPAGAIRRALEKVTDAVRTARLRHKGVQDAGGTDALSRALDGIFALSPFKNLWMEYCASLHLIAGRDGRKTVLATAPAEAFFSRENVVDLHINADFYRHLPGILTGIGIIGTFSGLVWGLHEFTPDTSDAVASLPLLLQEVTSAFVGSGFAILAAIFVTYKEKSVLNGCYRAVGELTREIDGLYATGAGEEYLARLVAATEGGVSAQERQHQALAQQVGSAIREALAEPMKELAAVVDRAAANQEKAVGRILDKVLESFSERLDVTFGSQIKKVNDSFATATEAMEQVRDSMTVLLGDMAAVGINAVDQMSGTLARAVEDASAAQDRLNEQTRAFLDEMRDLLLRNQNQTSEVMDVTMRAVLAKLQAAMTRLAVDRGEQVEQDRKRIEELTASVAKLVTSVDTSSARTAESLGILQNTASGAISGMNNGAVVMRMAADRFAIAGNTLSDALEKSEALTETVGQLQELLASTVQLRRAG
ncbi:MAG: hypothetical protein KGL10_05640 [Alphaproteobacteria bacterium]|nr:hypothetical protein [Alphaproteobacteria bacterium]MDE2336776.1 hypothetical protein [Alphaproteobacteria bacterium]